MHVFPSLDSDPIQNVMAAILALPLMFFFYVIPTNQNIPLWPRYNDKNNNKIIFES